MAAPPATAEPSNAWESLKGSLSETEKETLSIALQGEKGIKELADRCGVMQEVLIDQINEKAMDAIGDNLIDECCALYDDYVEQVRELVR